MIPLVALAALLVGAAPDDHELIQKILAETEPLDAPRGERLPLLVWPAHDLGTEDEAEIDRLLEALDARGMTAIAKLDPDDPRALERALTLGRLSQRRGMPIAVSATAATYAFFDGSPETAHVDENGRPFFDDSFGDGRKMGCPFALEGRVGAMVARVEDAVEAYRRAGLRIDLLYADWEVDGPLEWNGAWEASKRCVRCRREVPDIESFESFQDAVRRERAKLEKKMLAEPVLARFPGALVGNYAVYPHGGRRYWYDYFEELVDGGRPRRWYPEFEETGFTMAMPVTYPWYRSFAFYDFESSDYRWFYGMLLAGTNAARATPASVPLVPFVHWHTTEPPPEPDPKVRQLDPGVYRELLWHLLLRGHDTFFLWSPREEALEEVALVAEVYRDSHRYRDFLLEAEPVVFDVPAEPSPVVSAMRLGSRLLVRRTDFDEREEPARITVDGRSIDVPRAPGRCQWIDLAQTPVAIE